MQTGISTASLFGRFFTEDAVEELSGAGVKTAEVFLETYGEYTPEFGELIKKRKDGMDIHSVHVLTTQYEPQLYSMNERAKADSFKLLEGTARAAEILGAKYYTFHGGARFRKEPLILNLDNVGEETRKIVDVLGKHGVSLAYENVHWGYYNYIGFFSELKKRVPNLKGTFDIKQARQSGISYKEFISEMGEAIVTAHISDINENGKMCLPGKGITDFKEVFSRLKDVGFDGAILIESYNSDYKELKELYESLDFVTETAEKVFK